ncbi:MAG: outer membrane protein assembly factor BamD, partial [Daejeonella sp.]
MFKNKLNIPLSILLLIIIAIAGCKSNYEKLRASNDTAKKYREAVKFYDNKNYSKALPLFDDLVQKY